MSNSNELICKADSSVEDFLTRESFLSRRFLDFSSYWHDIHGGTKAGQKGMVVVSAKNALRNGIALFLILEQVTFREPSEAASTYELLARHVGEGSPTFQEAWRLERLSPASDDEVAHFGEACLEFLDETLGLKPWRFFYGELRSQEGYVRYHDRLLDLASAAKQLGITPPRSRESIEEGIRIRTMIADTANLP